jgi:glycosyltransferase involved in cell wall biosynthesis
VLPSYYEGVPRFLLEAAACGLPLIGTDIEGCRLVIADGENGLIVPPANAPALAEALERLVRDASLRARLGLASRALAVARFDQKRILTEYLAFYRRIGLFSVAEAT